MRHAGIHLEDTEDDVLVDGVEVKDGSHGADGDATKLLVGLEGQHHLVAFPCYSSIEFVPVGEPIAAGLVEHGDGRSESFMRCMATAGAAGLDQVDHGGDVVASLPNILNILHSVWESRMRRVVVMPPSEPTNAVYNGDSWTSVTTAGIGKQVNESTEE